MIVAMLALFVALTGTAVATTSALITGKQIKNSSITGADVKNKSLTPRDFRGSVRGPRGLQGPAGQQGAQGAPGTPGAPGAPGTAKAYALVSGSATILTPYTKGTWSVRRAAGQPTGVFCVTPPAGINPETDPAIVTVEWGSSSGSDLLAYWNKVNSFQCGTATEYEVRTYDFQREPTTVELSNSVHFLITIP